MKNCVENSRAYPVKINRYFGPTVGLVEGTGGLMGWRQSPTSCWGRQLFAGAEFRAGGSAHAPVSGASVSLFLYRLHGLPTEFSEYYSAIVGSWPNAATIGDSRCRANTGVTGGIGEFFGLPPGFCLLGPFCLGARGTTADYEQQNLIRKKERKSFRICICCLT